MLIRFLARKRRTLAVALLFLTVFPVFPAEAAGAVLCLCAQGHITLETDCAGTQCCDLHGASEPAHDACGTACTLANVPLPESGCTDIPLPVRNASMTAVNTQKASVTAPGIDLLPATLLTALDPLSMTAPAAVLPDQAPRTAARLSARSTVLRC